MMKAIFDFSNISNKEDFYKVAKKQLALPAHFGNNLDALWDCVTGEMELPAQVQFINLTLNQLEQFNDFISLFEDANVELDDEFTFQYFLRKEK